MPSIFVEELFGKTMLHVYLFFQIAPGWNFRHSQYFLDGSRTLVKSYGLLFQLDVQGRAGKLSFVPFAVNLGVGLALLSIATVVCDVIVLYCMKDRVVYR